MGLETMLLTGMIALHNPTQLNDLNIQGEYLLRAHDVYMVALINMKNEKASISFRTQVGQNTQCIGSYKFDKKQMTILTHFENCAGGKLSHRLNLKGQVLETLKSGVEVSVEVQINDSKGTLPFSLTKRN